MATEAFSAGERCEAEHSSPSSKEVKNEWSYTSIHYGVWPSNLPFTFLD